MAERICRNHLSAKEACKMKLSRLARMNRIVIIIQNRIQMLVIYPRNMNARKIAWSSHIVNPKMNGGLRKKNWKSEVTIRKEERKGCLSTNCPLNSGSSPVRSVTVFFSDLKK